jgi:hypothetical protein
MATTTFYDGQTVIYAAWLNDVNNAVYNGNFPNGILNVTTINATNANLTTATVTNLVVTNFSYAIGNFTISASGTKLYFAYNASNIASLDSSGNFRTLTSSINGTTP